jgi:hypothetical protein
MLSEAHVQKVWQLAHLMLSGGAVSPSGLAQAAQYDRAALLAMHHEAQQMAMAARAGLTLTPEERERGQLLGALAEAIELAAHHQA